MILLSDCRAALASFGVTSSDVTPTRKSDIPDGPPKKLDIPGPTRRWKKDDELTHVDRFKNSRALFEQLEKANSGPTKPNFKAGTTFGPKPGTDRDTRRAVNKWNNLGQATSYSASAAQTHKTADLIDKIGEPSSNSVNTHTHDRIREQISQYNKSGEVSVPLPSQQKSEGGSPRTKCSKPVTEPSVTKPSVKDNQPPAFQANGGQNGHATRRPPYNRTLSSEVLPEPYHAPRTEVRPVRRPGSRTTSENELNKHESEVVASTQKTSQNANPFVSKLQASVKPVQAEKKENSSPMQHNQPRKPASPERAERKEVVPPVHQTSSSKLRSTERTEDAKPVRYDQLDKQISPAQVQAEKKEEVKPRLQEQHANQNSPIPRGAERIEIKTAFQGQISKQTSSKKDSAEVREDVPPLHSSQSGRLTSSKQIEEKEEDLPYRHPLIAPNPPVRQDKRLDMSSLTPPVERRDVDSTLEDAFNVSDDQEKIIRRLANCESVNGTPTHASGKRLSIEDIATSLAAADNYFNDLQKNEEPVEVSPGKVKPADRPTHINKPEKEELKPWERDSIVESSVDDAQPTGYATYDSTPADDYDPVASASSPVEHHYVNDQIAKRVGRRMSSSEDEAYEPVAPPSPEAEPEIMSPEEAGKFLSFK